MTSPNESPHDRFGAAYSEWLKARGAYYERTLKTTSATGAAPVTALRN